MFKNFFKAWLFSFLLAGCAAAPPVPSQAEVVELSTLLRSLDKRISQDEAMQLSLDIFHETQKLVEVFELTSPPLFHNSLVNMGIKKKGLCYHWSDALYAHFSQENYSSFGFHLVGANIGEYFFEHNALVVVAKGGPVQKGILIDPWRNSGKLYFSRVVEDKKYQWKHREEREFLRAHSSHVLYIKRANRLYLSTLDIHSWHQSPG